MKYGTPGTVSHGTMRSEDLLESFANELEALVQDNAEELCSDPELRGAYLGIVWEARELSDDDYSESVDFVLEALFEALDDFAPPGHHFGSHPGDGSDFGFWGIDYDDE